MFILVGTLGPVRIRVDLVHHHLTFGDQVPCDVHDELSLNKEVCEKRDDTEKVLTNTS